MTFEKYEVSKKKKEIINQIESDCTLLYSCPSLRSHSSESSSGVTQSMERGAWSLPFSMTLGLYFPQPLFLCIHGVLILRDDCEVVLKVPVNMQFNQ